VFRSTVDPIPLRDKRLEAGGTPGVNAGPAGVWADPAAGVTRIYTTHISTGANRCARRTTRQRGDAEGGWKKPPDSRVGGKRSPGEPARTPLPRCMTSCQRSFAPVPPCCKLLLLLAHYSGEQAASTMFEIRICLPRRSGSDSSCGCQHLTGIGVRSDRRRLGISAVPVPTTR
jgi:hypothetical protein